MNKPIRILNTNFEIQGEINDYESMFFTRSFSGIGSLEIRINRHKLYADTLREGNIIVVDNDYKKTFVIKNREIELGDSGKLSETWLIKAHELKTIVAQRITMPPNHTAYDNKSGNAETVMKHYIDTNIVNPTDSKRAISNFVIAESQNRGQHIEHQSRFKNLSDEMNELSTISGLGWIVYINPETKQYVFDCLESRDLTANQSTNPPVIFSPEFDSVKSLKFMESKLNYKNTAIVAGQGEGTARSVVEVGSLEGLERHEVYIDARDISSVDENQNAIPKTEIEAKLIDRGNQKLLESKQETFLEGQILTNSTFSYGLDYDLGDIVTIQNKDWGVTMDARITEIKEIYEKSGFRLEATFGNSFPTLIQKIKHEFKQTHNDGYITKIDLLEAMRNFTPPVVEEPDSKPVITPDCLLERVKADDDQSVSIYVNQSIGVDDATTHGLSENNPLRSLGYAISILPKHINTSIYIYLAPGTYQSVTIHGFIGDQIGIKALNTNNKPILQGLNVWYCTKVFLENIKLSPPSGTYISFTSVTTPSLSDCTISGTIRFTNCRGYIQNSAFHAGLILIGSDISLYKCTSSRASGNTTYDNARVTLDYSHLRIKDTTTATYFPVSSAWISYGSDILHSRYTMFK